MILFIKRLLLLASLGMVSSHTAVGQQTSHEMSHRSRGVGDKHYFLREGDVVLFLGNSITQQAEWELRHLKADIQQRYPELIRGEGLAVQFVLAGVGGEQAYEGAKRLPALLQKYKPTVCVINYGTCEITFENEQSFIPAMESIIEQLRAANVAITIVTNPPCSPEAWTEKKTSIPKFVKRLPVMAKKAKRLAKNEAAIVVDAYRLMERHQKSGGEELTTDGIHLNELGYRLMADALQQAWGYGLPLAKRP